MMRDMVSITEEEQDLDFADEDLQIKILPHLKLWLLAKTLLGGQILTMAMALLRLLGSPRLSSRVVLYS